MMTLLCPKQVAVALNASERTAARLMATGEIESIRIGPKLWRTTSEKVRDYLDRGFERYRRQSITVRGLQQTIVCLREIEHLGNLTDEQAEELQQCEERLRLLIEPVPEAVTQIRAA